MPATPALTDPALQRAVASGRIALAETAQAALTVPFSDKTNVILHHRHLSGDFNALACYFRRRKPKTYENFSVLTEKDLNRAANRLSGDARLAAQEVLADMQLLGLNGYSKMQLRLIHGQTYNTGKDAYNLVSNVHLFHFDGGHPVNGRVLIPYTDPTTESIDASECVRFIDIPAFRDDALARRGERPTPASIAALQKGWSANFYTPKPGAQPYAFKAGDIFRHACLNNKAGVPPHLHRAPPPMAKSKTPRLILVGDTPY